MNKIRNRKNNKGFSLVELIIVIAIMAILAGILIPQFVKYINNSKVSGDIQQAENIYNAIAAQYADAQGTEPTGMHYSDTQLYRVTDDVAKAIDMGEKEPTCKVDSSYAFYYRCTEKGVVTVYLGPNTVTSGETGKNVAASGVTQISPSIKGTDAEKWNGTDDTAL